MFQHSKFTYVTPNASSPCPGQSCFTLDQCTQQAEECFTTGATIVFMAGNHSLQTSMGLTNVSDVTLTGRTGDNSSDSVNIICINKVTISFNEVVNASIEGLNFFFGSFSGGISEEPTALFSVTGSEIDIIKIKFQGSGDLSILMGAIHAM